MEGEKTVFYEAHKTLGAKMVEFAGYLMPIWYESIKEEVMATRKAAGLFDICHMGRILISGKDSRKFLQHLITNDLNKLFSGRALYTLLCKENGGVIDDIVIYCLPSVGGLLGSKYLLVINAGCFAKDLDWFKEVAENFQVKIQDKTEELAMIALQGPLSCRILEMVGLKQNLLALKYFSHDLGRIFNIPVRISRTGYTGEDGFEIFVSAKKAVELWQRLLTIDKKSGPVPCGLAARDILRLEAGFPLYGHELSEEITPLEAGLERFVSFEKEDFIGKQALLEQKRNGVKKKLVGFEVLSGRIARQGYPVFHGEENIGQVASGNISFILNKSIGTAFVKTEFANLENLVEIDIRGQRHQALIVKLPFYP